MRRLNRALPGSSRSVNVSSRFPVIGSTCSKGSWLTCSRFRSKPLASNIALAAWAVGVTEARTAANSEQKSPRDREQSVIRMYLERFEAPGYRRVSVANRLERPHERRQDKTEERRKLGDPVSDPAF